MFFVRRQWSTLGLIFGLSGWFSGLELSAAAAAPTPAVAPIAEATAAVRWPTAPRKYVVTSEDVTSAAFKLVHDAGLDESVVDDLIVSALAVAAIDRPATDKYRLQVVEIKLPGGQTQSCSKRSFRYAGDRYFYDAEHLTVSDWYAADVATHTLTTLVAELSAAKAARSVESVIVRRDGGPDARISHDAQVLRLACQHYFHQGCLLTHHAYQGAAGATATCPIDRSEIDLSQAEALAAVRLRRGEALAPCSICLEALPTRQSRFDERFSRYTTKAAKRTYAEAVSAAPVRARSWADVVRGRKDAR